MKFRRIPLRQVRFSEYDVVFSNPENSIVVCWSQEQWTQAGKPLTIQIEIPVS